MKSDELVRRINNGEIKDGTKIEFRLNRKEPAYIYYRNKNLVYGEKSNGAGQFVDIGLLLDSNFEFEIVEEHKGWFKPNDGDYYYCIDHDGIIRRKEWEDNALNYYHYNNHNCFRHREEAYECERYREALKEAEKPFKPGEYNFYMFLNRDTWDNGGVELEYEKYGEIQGVTFLGQDEEVAQAFIDKWKPQILKYEFDVWE